MDQQTFNSLQRISITLYTINFHLLKNCNEIFQREDGTLLKKVKSEMVKARKLFERCRLYHPGNEIPIKIDKKIATKLQNLTFEEVMFYKNQVDSTIDAELRFLFKNKKVPSRIQSLLKRSFKNNSVRPAFMQNM